MSKQSKSASASKPTDDEDDDYDNDFEDYDEDFEASEDLKVAPPKQASISEYASAKTPITSQSVDVSQPVVKPLSEAKISSAVQGQSAKSTRGSIGASLSRSIADPRSVRIRRILNSNILDLKMERATIINIPPSTKYDLYLSELRSSTSILKQVGVPNDLEHRDVDVNTEEIVTMDKEVQFCDGDDTRFFNTLQKIQKKKTRSKASTESDSLIQEDTVIVSETSTGARLSEFVRRSSLIFDTILTEQESNKKEVSSNSRDQKLLSDTMPWERMGRDTKNGGNELLRSRECSLICFSSFQSNVVLGVHPYPIGAEADADLRPYKGLYSIWDTFNLGGPIYVLEGSGQPSYGCFSATQSHFLLGGTLDGCIHLWDLREPSSVHKDKDSIDLKISRGIRKPSFSTHLLNSTENTRNDIGNDVVHNGTIIQIEAFGEGSKADSTSFATSQFVSLDQGGKLIFWLTQDIRDDMASIHSLCCSPWGKVCLIATRSLQLGGQLNASIDANTEIFLEQRPIIHASAESSTLLIAESSGKLSKLVRIGEPTAPKYFQRPTSSEIMQYDGGKDKTFVKAKKSSISHGAAITCVAIRSSSEYIEFDALMLVGRIDGTIDLFQYDQQFPLHTWSLGSLLNNRNLKSAVLTPEIIQVQWLEFSAASFLAIDSAGYMHHFDLLMDIYKPFRTESLGISGPLSSSTVSFSTPRSHVDVLHVGFSQPGANFKLSMRAVNLGDIIQTSRPTKQNEMALRQMLLHSTAPIADSKTIHLQQSSQAKTPTG